MANEMKEKLVEQIKEQGELVRKLKSTKAEGSRPNDFNSALANIDAELAKVSYASGWVPTSRDKELFDFCIAKLNGRTQDLPHLERWFSNIESFTPAERSRFPVANEKTPLMNSIEKLIKSACLLSNSNLDDKIKNSVSKYPLEYQAFGRIDDDFITEKVESDLEFFIRSLFLRNSSKGRLRNEK